MIQKILLILALSFSLYGESCWNSLELASFAQDEFDSKAHFSVKDAVTCEAIPHVKFTLGKFEFYSDKNGVITLPLPPENLDTQVPIGLSKEGYLSSKESMLIVFGSYWNKLFLMSKNIPLESARFVLSWGNSPQDLDLHLKSNSYHISFRDTKSIENRVALDRDAMKGYGPETITVKHLDNGNSYRVMVSKYSQIGKIDNKTKLRVYLNNKLDKVVRLPSTNAKCVELATIVQNRITYKFKELDESECK